MRLCAIYFLLYKYFCIKKYHPINDLKNNYFPFQQMDIYKQTFKDLCEAPHCILIIVIRKPSTFGFLLRILTINLQQ